MSDEQLEQFVRRRLVEEGETPERAEELARALVDGETRDQALGELGERRERLADVVEQLEGDESHLPHPIQAAEHELEHLQDVAEEGKSPATPAILGGGLILILIPIVALLIGASLLTAYLVTRGDDSSTTTGGTANGEALFSENCASCHTLAAANASGKVKPNLDQLEPSKSVVVKKVTNGGGGMPAFGGRLSTAQIEAIAEYVARVAGQ
jgi:mono/diheme cytochrome c family protein